MPRETESDAESDRERPREPERIRESAESDAERHGERHPETRREPDRDRERPSEMPRDGELVFHRPNGQPWNPSTVRVELSKLCGITGVPEVTPNELRHSCASLLSDRGIPHVKIADLLGHSSTKMLDSVYRHRVREVVDITQSGGWASTVDG